MFTRRARHLVVPGVVLAFVAMAWLIVPQTPAPLMSGVHQKHESRNFEFINLPGSSGQTLTIRQAATAPPSTWLLVSPTISRVPTWPRHVFSGKGCDGCDSPTILNGAGSEENALTRRGVLSIDRPSGPAAAAAQSNGYQAPPRESLMTDSDRGVTIQDRIDLGFPYDPAAWHDGVLEITNKTPGQVVVSLHGASATTCTIDGMPVVEGQQYIVDGTIQLHGSALVGVHVRTNGLAVQPRPSGNG